MPIRAIIFDFDGLILDTETPEVEVWKAIYAEHGHAYGVEHWSQIIGGWGLSTFDPAAALQAMTPAAVDVEQLRGRHRRESNARILSAGPMEGVHEILADASRSGLRCSIASSSERDWVVPHLSRLGILEHFDPIITGDDVPEGRTKPHPDIYVKALRQLGIDASEAVVLEDSPNGVTAAHAAGLRVVCVPNPVTAELQMEPDLKLRSLAELPLAEIISRVERLPGRTPGQAAGEPLGR